MSFRRKYASASRIAREKISHEVSTPTVLLIENSAEDTQIFEQHLRKAALHWKLTSVSDGFSGIRHMTLHGFPSLLVTRLETPRFGALEVAEWIRTMKTPGPLPVMIFDKAVEPELRRQLEQYDVTEFLEKHASAQALQSQLRRMVELIELSACTGGRELDTGIETRVG